MFWAPLIGGSTQEEKDQMDHELAAAGKATIPDRYHPNYVKARQNDPGNLNRQLFFELQDPKAKIAIAGVPNDPLEIDPPGCGSPFDALRHPDRLVEKLNRLPNDPDDTLYAWDVKALKKIPHSLISKLAPEALAALPREVMITLPAKILERLPHDTPFFINPPSTGKFKRPGQRQSGRLALQRALPRKKMGKVAHACHRCRVKRMGCDAARPSCTPCVNAGLDCSFEVDVSEQHQDLEEEGTAAEPSTTTAPVAFTFESRIEGLETRLSPASGSKSVDADDVPMTNFRRLTSPEDYDPISDTSDAEGDRLAVEAMHLLVEQTKHFGIDKNAIKHHNQRAGTDHLNLAVSTSIPLKYHPKATFSTNYNVPKQPQKKRTAKELRKGLEANEKAISSQTPADSRNAYVSSATPQEETFHSRPSVRIVVPDHLKNLLVDDWENVTKALLLVPLPSQAPVNFIIDTYFDEEKGKRRLGSDEADLLEEFVTGMKTYFEKACGKILLYRFERDQWADVRQTVLFGQALTRWHRFANCGRVGSIRSGMERDQEMRMVQST